MVSPRGVQAQSASREARTCRWAFPYGRIGAQRPLGGPRLIRARNIKPGIFKNELLGAADPLLTLLFEGLWCMADREGRLEDRPLRIKAEIFPYPKNLRRKGVTPP